MNTRNTRALVSLGDDSEDDEFRLLNSGKANRAADKAKAKATLQNLPAASPNERVHLCVWGEGQIVTRSPDPPTGSSI